MNPAPGLVDDFTTWTALWLFLLAVAVAIGVHILIQATRDSWREAGARLDEGVARLLDDPIRTWREEVYDQDLDGTDLDQWNKEMDAS